MALDLVTATAIQLGCIFAIVAALSIALMVVSRKLRKAPADESKVFTLFSVILPFDILKIRLQKTENGGVEEVVLYNGRKVESLKLLAVFLIISIQVAMWLTFVTIHIEATEYRDGCSLDAILEDDSEWQCRNMDTKKDLNCHSTFKNALNFTLPIVEVERQLKQLTKHVSCARLNLDMGEAFGLGYVSYQLLFLFLIGLEKMFIPLRDRFGFRCTSIALLLTCVVVLVAFFLISGFVPSLFRYLVRFLYPYPIAAALVPLSSRFGSTEMTEMVHTKRASAGNTNANDAENSNMVLGVQP